MKFLVEFDLDNQKISVGRLEIVALIQIEDQPELEISKVLCT